MPQSLPVRAPGPSPMRAGAAYFWLLAGGLSRHLYLALADLKARCDRAGCQPPAVEVLESTFVRAAQAVADDPDPPCPDDAPWSALTEGAGFSELMVWIGDALGRAGQVDPPLAALPSDPPPAPVPVRVQRPPMDRDDFPESVPCALAACDKLVPVRGDSYRRCQFRDGLTIFCSRECAGRRVKTRPRAGSNGTLNGAAH